MSSALVDDADQEFKYLDQAMSILIGLSQHTNVKMSTVARALNEGHCGRLTTENAMIFAQVDAHLNDRDLVERWQRRGRSSALP